MKAALGPQNRPLSFSSTSHCGLGVLAGPAKSKRSWRRCGPFSALGAKRRPRKPFYSALLAPLMGSTKSAASAVTSLRATTSMRVTGIALALPVGTPLPKSITGLNAGITTAGARHEYWYIHRAPVRCGGVA